MLCSLCQLLGISFNNATKCVTDSALQFHKTGFVYFHPPTNLSVDIFARCCIFRPAFGCWLLNRLVVIVIFSVFWIGWIFLSQISINPPSLLHSQGDKIVFFKFHSCNKDLLKYPFFEKKLIDSSNLLSECVRKSLKMKTAVGPI